MAMAAQAKVFRVNNVAGMAPYQTINDAVKAAAKMVSSESFTISGKTDIREVAADFGFDVRS